MTFRTRHRNDLSRTFWVGVAVLLLLAGCGRTGDDESSFGGGIGGTGTGTIDRIMPVVTPNGNGTGRNSGPVLVMGETRHFTISPDTELMVDGEHLAVEALPGDAGGMVASLLVDKDANPAFTRGTALKVHFHHTLIGPVTSEPPSLEVLGQPVEQGEPSGNQTLHIRRFRYGDRNSPFPLGSIVKVSGYPDRENQVEATRVESAPWDTPFWLLKGPVRAVEPGRMMWVRDQAIALAGVRVENCAGGILSEDWVEVKAMPIPWFYPGRVLDTASVVRCVRQGLAFPEGAQDEPVAAELEGRVYDVTPSGFVMGGQWVKTDDRTVYNGGTPTDVARGRMLRVSGVFMPLNDTLHALKVRIFAP